MADSKYRSVKDIIDDAKKQPDTIVCAVTSALGTGRQTLWQDYSKKNMYEDAWMTGAAFAQYLAEQRAVQAEFIQSIGVSKKA